MVPNRVKHHIYGVSMRLCWFSHSLTRNILEVLVLRLDPITPQLLPHVDPIYRCLLECAAEILVDFIKTYHHRFLLKP